MLLSETVVVCKSQDSTFRAGIAEYLPSFSS